MTRWILANLPSWLLLAALVIGITALTMATLVFVKRRFPGLADGDHNDIAKVGFAVVGPTFGFMIGFIVSALWGQVGTADQAVRTEAASAVQMARELDAFDKADGDRLRERVLAYERAALVEWPQAVDGRTTAEAEAALADLHAAYNAISPADDTQRNALSSSLASLKQVGLSRTERLTMARTNIGPPLSLWSAVLLLSALVLGFAVIIGEKKARMHYAMVAAVSVLVAVLLYLVTELSFPFHGELGTTAEPLRAAVTLSQT